MTFFNETNEDARSVSPETASTGPLVGFLESWRMAVDTQMRTSSQFGVEYFMHDLDWKQTKKMLDAGVEDAPQLGTEVMGMRLVPEMRGDEYDYNDTFSPARSYGYMDVAERYSGFPTNSDVNAKMDEYDARITKLRETNPDLGLMTSKEMFTRVQEDAKASEEADQNARRSWGGAFGGFFGAALSSMHPDTDPLNFLTLGVGGAGKTVVKRIAAQVGGQGVIETINQVTGVQKEREILGLSHGFSDGAMRVAQTAGGAGLLQGVGEVVGAGLKRWFRNTTADPAPPRPPVAQRDALPVRAPDPAPEALKLDARTAQLEQNGTRSYLDLIADQTPLSGIRVGKPRVAADLRDMTEQLSAWDAGPVATMRPRTSVASYPGETRPVTLDTKPAVENNRAYQEAKARDPVAFTQYEKLVERRNTYRQWVEELGQGRNADVQKTSDAIQQRLFALEAQHRSTQGRTNKLRIREEIADIKKDQAALLKVSGATETPDIAMVRKSLMETDERMRDLAPLIGRAYARSEGRWGETPGELDAVWGAYRKGDRTPDTSLREALDPDVMMTLYDRVPALTRATTDITGKTPVQIVKEVAEADAKVMEAMLERHRADIKRLLSETAKGEKVKVEGSDYEFDIDKDRIFVELPDGTAKEISVREMLEDVQRTDQELEAISTCSIR